MRVAGGAPKTAVLGAELRFDSSRQAAGVGRTGLIFHNMTRILCYS